MRGWDRYSAVMLLGLVAGVIGCSDRGGAGDGGDAVAADVGLSDAEAGEILADAEVDGTDSVTDVIADVADAPDIPPDIIKDTDAGPECPVIPDDVTAADDVPYWIAHDVDLSGLGVVNPKGSAQCDPYLKVNANDLPVGPTCTSACPAPYPCTCGACPWIQTPAMNVPRFWAEAVWTGSEVLVFGGRSITGIGDGPEPPFSAERWNPSDAKGFQMIPLPPSVTTNAFGSSWTRVFWTGSQALVVQDAQQFLYDPKDNTVQKLPLAPVLYPHPDSLLWTGDRLFWWGWDRATDTPTKAFPAIATWDKTSGWQKVALPTDLVQVTAGAPRCMAALNGDVYVFDPEATPKSEAGLDPCLPVMLRYSLQSKTWLALPQTMLPNLRCSDNGNILFAAFPDGIAFIPGAKFDGYTLHQLPGEIWWQATGKWTAMQPPPLKGSDHSFALWTGSHFVLHGENDYKDPITDGKLPNVATNPDYPTWPTTYDPYKDEFGYTTSIGYPKHHRWRMAAAYTGTELFMLGGTNGVSIQTIHTDGVRLSLPNP